MIYNYLLTLIQILKNNLDLILFITILLTSFIIYYKSRKFYKLSSYQGFKHFANAFLFLGLSAITSFSKTQISSFWINSTQLVHNSPILKIYESLTFVNYYFLAMAVFLLIYSLVWKEIKNNRFNILILNLIAFILSYIAYQKEYLFYIVIIILLIYGIIISYEKYINSKNNHSQLYLLSLILITISFVIQLLLGFFEIIQTYANVTSIGVFLILLYLTIKK
ncbi:MAG: hypothetical protein HRU03_03790 [Nanoarchaeales archaeon]|nr:hypothetical protein [Nanoarchaeales archaeon]